MALTAEKISFAYAQKTVLKDFSISLERDNFTMLLGSNGSGKSTVIKLLSSFLKPACGMVEMDGRPMEKLSAFERARKIAVVSQIMPPILNFTVEEMVIMGRFCRVGRLHKPSDRDLKIVNDTMDKLGIASFASRYVRELSGGERQRVMLAMALAQRPDYLLLDEPTAALDPSHSLGLMEILKLLKGKIGILMVCHDLNLAWNYAEKVIILKDGSTVFEGDTHKILTAENIKKAFDCNAVIHPSEGIILQK